MTAVVGLLLGLLMGLLARLAAVAFEGPLGTWLPLGVSLFLGLGMVGLTVAKREDLLWPPRRSGSSAGRARPASRTAAATRTSSSTRARSSTAGSRKSSSPGFIYGTLVVPKFVLEELQHIADSSDTLRRNRGRRGLEILARMQKESTTPVEIVDEDVPDVGEVDAKLVALARARSKAILTNDFNLNRVAELQGIRVLNINSLANAVKPAVLPGEELRVRVIQEGKEAGQGVGFLDDGTMIVVEGGVRYIDKDLDVAVTRVLQTVAGRMIFAQPRLD